MVASTSIRSEQHSSVQQGTNSSGNKVNLSLDVTVNNKGTAHASAGDASAAGQVGGVSFSASVKSSATASLSSSPSATTSPTSSVRPASSATPVPGVSVTSTNGASATSGKAAAIGVVADTSVIGNQAVVIHIPPNTSNQTIQVSLDAEVSNTGIAFSQSGSVDATGLIGSTSVGVGGPAPSATNRANTVSVGVGSAGSAPGGTAPHASGGSTTGAGPAPPSVDVRSTNYAIANSGDAMAIGVKADTVVRGIQKISVIIDDNSSGNRIVITFHVHVQNQGQATAASGRASATGQRGNLAVGVAGYGSGSASADLGSSGWAGSGSATAIGVDALSRIEALQSASLSVGNNSSNNVVNANFDVSIANSGGAWASTGTTSATGQAGSVAIGDRGGASGSSVSSVTAGATILNRATGQSGDASSVGLNAGTSLLESQGVNVSVAAGSGLPITISQVDRVVNLGLAISRTGNVSVVAQVAPPDPSGSPQPSPSPSPLPSASPSTAIGSESGQAADPSAQAAAVPPPGSRLARLGAVQPLSPDFSGLGRGHSGSPAASPLTRGPVAAAGRGGPGERGVAGPAGGRAGLAAAETVSLARKTLYTSQPGGTIEEVSAGSLGPGRPVSDVPNVAGNPTAGSKVVFSWHSGLLLAFSLLPGLLALARRKL
ncbi:MAG: hypothetical protein ACYDAG_09265 [Chloroflexota bacterium]